MIDNHVTWGGKTDWPLHQEITERIGHGVDILHNGGTFFDPDPKLSTYWFGKSSVQLYTYLLTLVAGANKQQEPMTLVDPTLVACLNARKYFSYSLGDVYDSQHEAVESAVALRQVGTFLFAPVYNLQKATARPRIWSLSLYPVREDGKWGLYGQAVMGHCSVWPMLPYELLGAIAISQLIVGKVGVPLRGFQWYFHSLMIPGVSPDGWKMPDISQAPDKLPSHAVAAELISAEAKLRRTPDIRPMLRVPVGALETRYIDDLQRVYMSKETANAKSAK